MQDAYVRAYQHLASFEGRAKFVTWLTRIAVHEALARSRKRARFPSIDIWDESNGDTMNSHISSDRSPEQETYGREVDAVLESACCSAVGRPPLRFMLRDVEGMSTEETAAVPQPDPGERQGASAPGPCQAAKATLCGRGSDGCALLPVSRSAL